MPDFTYMAETGAGAAVQPLATWRYRKLPYPARVTILVNAELDGVTMQLMAGAQEIVQNGSAVQLQSAAGRLPCPDGADSSPVFQFTAGKDDEVDLVVTPVAAETPFIGVWANVEPIG